MKILIIGSGGREHALAWRFSQSKKVSKIFCAPGNPGTKKIAQNVEISSSDIDGLLRFAKKEKIDLTFVGPEAPLIAGIADLFQKNDLKIIGPRKNAAAIEGSKVFAKKLMLKYKIPTGEFAIFDDYKYAREFLKTQKYPLVIKAEGQCFGKGVAVCKNSLEAQSFLKDVMVRKIFGDEGKRVLVEEYLCGQEISFMVVTDGFNFVSLLPSQDHKKINDKDKGPNTGGMGAYAPVPFLHKKLLKRIEKDIVRPTIEALRKEGCLYEGILYPGLILTDEGPKVLEFNCRFGDPETQPLMMLLKNDLMEICQAILAKKVKNLKLAWQKGAAVCVVLSSKGYPGKYRKGDVVKGLDSADLDNHLSVFHSGTKEEKGKILTNSGRVLGVTGKGSNLAKAMKLTYGNIGKKVIHFSGMHYRKDIGLKGLEESLWE
ncbi:phosphoribosylamine--glycine ligase [Patescibacteria group bacterium]|nr:phosphoribosylamine--glycine ligase [Patescibacteria group bacterium]MCL5797749.1 phosphoribosylamine--glycine ligase [Patescibacteria group bacterium]